MIVTADKILENIPDYILKKAITDTKTFSDKEYYLQSSAQNMMYATTFMSMTREELIETIQSIHDAMQEAKVRLLNS